MSLRYITYYSAHYLFLICFMHVPHIFNSCGINFGNVFNRLRPSVKSLNPKIIFLFLNQNIYCGYLKEPSH